MSNYDLFISYSHLDNGHLYDSEQGWVDFLHRNLEIRLSQLLGRKPEIWRDPKLKGSDYFSEVIRYTLSQAAVMVSIISPSYVNSERCMRELREFHDLVSSRVDDRSRIFKVIKTPVAHAEQPQELQDLLGYEFFEIDQATKRIREFGYDVGLNYDKRYWGKFEDMAQDIKRMIDRPKDLPPVLNHPGKTIYLAETTSDLTEARDNIRRELQLSGHRILPDRPLPYDSRFRNEANKFIAESHLSVHLVGALYGVIPEGESKSIIELQRELASNRVGANGFAQIIWMPQEINPSDNRQEQYIEELNNLNLPNGYIIRQFRLEDLKTLIYEKLRSPELQESIVPKAYSDESNPLVVYIVYDKPDYEAIKPISEYLFQHGFDVLLTDPKRHRHFLQICDAVLIYYGNTTEGWLQMKRIDLLKVRRAKPMLAKAFYLDGTKIKSKEQLKIQDGIVIRNFGTFTYDSLDPFIEQLERARGIQR